MKISEKISQTFEYKILIKWVFLTESLCLLIFLLFMVCDELDGNGFLKYVGLQKEGIQKIQVLDYFSDTEDIVRRKYGDDIEITTYRLECSTVLDGKEYFFVADAADVIGKNSDNVALEYINYKKEVTGYLYSSRNRESLYFSYNMDEAGSLLYEKVKYRCRINYYRTYGFRIILYIIIGLWVLNSFKMKDNESIIEIVFGKVIGFLYFRELQIMLPSISERKNRTVVAKDNYSDKAIKMNSEYKWFAKEAFEKEYSPEIIAVAENLNSGEYRISAKQTETIKEFIKTAPGRQKLTGPILEKYVLGHDAVLLMIGFKIPFTKKRWAKLIERTMEGNYAERKVKVDCAFVRDIMGSYVFVVNGKEGIGIYENISKNEDNPIMLNYEKYLRKNPFSKIGCYIQQVLLAIISFVALMVVWQITKDWIIFPKIAFCLVTARLYKHLISLLRRKYIVGYRTIGCESMFHKFWKVPYFVLNVLALVIVWIKPFI